MLVVVIGSVKLLFQVQAKEKEMIFFFFLVKKRVFQRHLRKVVQK